MSDDLISSTLNQAGQVGTVLVTKGPRAAAATAITKAGAGLTGSAIPEAVEWDLDKANGVPLKGGGPQTRMASIGPGDLSRL